MSNKPEFSDVLEIYSKVLVQFDEDREEITELLKDLKAYVKSDPDRWVDCGDTLAKYCDLRVKQTSQVLDVLKIAHSSLDDAGSLDDKDFDFISKEIEKEDVFSNLANDESEEKPAPPEGCEDEGDGG